MYSAVDSRAGFPAPLRAPNDLIDIFSICLLYAPAASPPPGGGQVSRTRYARGGGLRIAYEQRGTMFWRRPWLVLIQGMGLDRLGWEPVLRPLRRHFRLVLVDNR